MSKSSRNTFVDEIRKLLTDNNHLVLQFERLAKSFNPDSIMAELSAQLPEYSVFFSGITQETNNITIKKVIDEQVVLENANLFLQAIDNYLQTADELITNLAKKLNFPPEEITEEWRYKLEFSQTKGKLEDSWEYWFHGHECRFKNFLTGQIVEARLRDYGQIQAVPDPFFLAQFIRTSDEEGKVSELIEDDFHDMKRVLEILVRMGYLK